MAKRHPVDEGVLPGDTIKFGNVPERDSRDHLTGLPKGWAQVTLTEICELNPALPQTVAPNAKVSFVPMAAVSELSGTIVEAQIREYQEVCRGYTTFITDDVLWAKITPCMENGKAAVARDLVNGVGCGSTEFFVLRSTGAVLPDLLLRFLRQASYRQAARKTMNSAVGQARVPKRFLLETPFMLPPLQEQRRILTHLEALEARSSRARAALDTLPALLSHARQSLLSAAFRGDLTKDWRADNPDAPDGMELLAKLQEYHRQTGTKSKANAAQATEGVHDLSPDLLPNSWVIAELRDLCYPTKPICYGILMPGPEKDEGVPYIRVADFPNDRIRTETVRKTTPEIDAKFLRSRLTTGDLLVSIRGTVGRVAVVPPELNGANITQDSARLSIHDSVNASFIAAMLRAPETQQRMQRAVKGVAVRGINIGDVRPLQVPLPPLSEQIEIVRRLESAFARLDVVAAAHTAAIAELNRLDASLLAKVFRGELVPQDPADEPAAVTLQRLQTPREVFDPFAYLFQFIPALLRASEGRLPFARALEGCALLRVPRDLIRLLEPIAGAPARHHFVRFAQPLKDGSFEPVLRKLITVGAITHDTRGDHTLRLVEAEAPPIDPLIVEDARLVASVLALVPSDTLEDLVPRHTRKLCSKTAATMLAF